MTIDFKKLKEMTWRKWASSIIILVTMFVLGAAVMSFIAAIVMLLIGSAWSAYQSSPTTFHWLAGVLTVLGLWIWLWDWAEKQ